MKITRRQLRKIIAEATGTFYRHKPRDPKDVLSAPDRFDHARTQEELFEKVRRYISSAISRRLNSRGMLQDVSQADLKYMSFALMREITTEAGEYTGLSLDKFLKKIRKGELDEKIDSMVSEAMKFRHDGRSMDQVSRDIKAGPSPQPEKKYYARPLPAGMKTQQPAPVDQSAGETITSLTQPADLSREELSYYNNAQDKDVFMAGYNAGADDGADDEPMKYGSEDSDNDPNTSMDDYATGYRLGYIAFS